MDQTAAIQAALESLLTQFQAACAAPKPSYSIDGQSVSWGEYLRMLTDGIKAATELHQFFSPVELRSVVL